MLRVIMQKMAEIIILNATNTKWIQWIQNDEALYDLQKEENYHPKQKTGGKNKQQD